MKIIDKRRDYYDYLSGIYGINEKLVLDRREYDNQISSDIIKFYIAGYIVEGLLLNDKFYYGDDLNQFKIKKKSFWLHLSKHWKRDYDNSIEIEYNDGSYKKQNWVYIKPIKDDDAINNRFDCPILMQCSDQVYKYPLLKNFNLATFIPPETIYKWIEEWLSRRISLLEVTSELPNDLKIESKGFDKKTSFRTKIK